MTQTTPVKTSSSYATPFFSPPLTNCSYRSNGQSASPAPKDSTTNGGKSWVPAEEEKHKLYEKAQAKALKTQAKAASAAGGSAAVGRSGSTRSVATSINSSILSPYAY